MATLWRILSRGRPTAQVLLSRSKQRCLLYRPISTTENSKDMPTATAVPDNVKTQELKELEEHFADADPEKLKNWVSLGWSQVDRELDEWHHNVVMFLIYTVVLVGGAFTLWSIPDFKNTDWAVREAYFDMERREKAGLPLIDPYTVPPEQIELPPEEEIDIDIHV